MKILPIYQNYRFFYDIYLDDIRLSFSFYWNIAINTFLMTMKRDEIIVFKNSSLCTGVDFLKTSGIGELGILVLVDNQTNSQDDPSAIEDFISRFTLIYVSNNEDILNEII